MKDLFGEGATSALPLALVLSLLLLCAIAIGGARAALPPYAYEEARREAPYHLQVAVERVAPPASTPGFCDVTGKIVTLFRDKSGALALGQAIGFKMACIRETDDTPLSGTIYTDLTQLTQAKYIEAYLADQDGGLKVALSQALIIEAPSSTPQLPVVQGRVSGSP